MEDRRPPLPRETVREPGAAPLDQPAPPVVPGRTTTRVDDMAAAELTRHRLRLGPLEAIPPDDAIRPLLCPAELVVAVRHDALVDWHPVAAAARSIRGDVYLTSARLVVTGEDNLTWDLGLVREADVTDRQLLLALDDGAGIALTISRPASFRVKVQAARQGRVRA